MRCIFAFVLVCFACAAQAASPGRIVAEYDLLTRGIKLGEVREVFTREGDRYRIVSTSKPVGLLAVFKPETILVTSEGEITPEGLRPQKFTHSREHAPEKNNRADFDWPRGILTVSDRAGVRQLPLPPLTQDRLSVMYQFIFSPPQPGTPLDLQVTNGSKLQPYRYLIDPAGMAKVPYGELHTWYLHTPPEPTPWKSEVWLATERNFFPAKVALTEDNGNLIVQVLRTLEILP